MTTPDDLYDDDDDRDLAEATYEPQPEYSEPEADDGDA